MTYAGPSPVTGPAVPAARVGPGRDAPLLLAAGQVLAGRYRLLQLLSAEPASATWHALDEVLARPVAIRAVPAEEPRSAAFLAAAARVGALPTRLTTRIYDAAVEAPAAGPAVAYVVSEWVCGPWLAGVVADGPLAPGRAAELVTSAAESLAAMHGAGVVHGRLHPGNVVLEAGVRLRFTDGAVAAALRGTAAAAVPADDVRALAAVLYALLTATWPARCTPQPAAGLPPAPPSGRGTCAPRQVRAGVPRALDRLVVTALGAAPGGEQPPRTAAELVTALEHAAVAEVPGSAVRRSRLRPFR